MNIGNEFNGAGRFIQRLNQGSEVIDCVQFFTLLSDRLDKYAQSAPRCWCSVHRGISHRSATPSPSTAGWPKGYRQGFQYRMPSCRISFRTGGRPAHRTPRRSYLCAPSHRRGRALRDCGTALGIATHNRPSATRLLHAVLRSSLKDQEILVRKVIVQRHESVTGGNQLVLDLLRRKPILIWRAHRRPLAPIHDRQPATRTQAAA